MIYVGIDVASEKHDCCILGEDKQVLSSFTIRNDAQGFDLLLKNLAKQAPHENIRVGLEATGIYGTNLVSFLRRNGIEATTLNPLLLKNSIKATTLRKTKTDKTDAKHIASFLMQEAPQPDLPVSYHISELKSLTRCRFKMVQDRSKAKIQAKGALKVLFPELGLYFSDIFGATASAVLTEYPSAQAISKVRVDSLARVIRKASRGRFGREKAEALKDAAKRSIATYSAAQELSVRFCFQKIELLDRQIRELDRQIKQLMVLADSPITTIPGIGWTLGAIILAEIGDIKRFSSPAKLLSFMGAEPSVYESGKYAASSGRMVKRGSPYLRWAILQAAKSVSRFSNTFSLYMTKKQNEHKHYNVAASHCAKKLVRVIFAILDKNIPFSDDHAPIAA